jgi:hypothetical protein
MSDQADNPPKSNVLWRITRWLLFIAACLATLIALFYAEENWRGRHAWEKYKHEWEAKGEKFDFASFVPPPVPDDQNFAMTPLLAPLYDFNPEPRQPGQTWRDTNGYNRVVNFASGLLNLSPPQSQPDRRRWADPRKTDYDIWRELLGANSTNRAFASPAEAAKELLKSLEKYQPELAELEAASHRPYSRFNIDYQTEPAFGTLLPHLGILKRYEEVFALRARAESVLGQTDAAQKDIGVALVLARSEENEPFLISSLVEFSLLNITIQEIQQGLTAHQWSDAELADLETKLGKIDLLAEYGNVMRGERALNISGLDYLARNRRQVGLLSGISYEGKQNQDDPPFAILQFVPSGWYRQNQLAISRLGQELYLAPVDAAHHRVDAAEAAKWREKLDQEFARGFLSYEVFARLLLPAMGHAPIKFAAEQTEVDEALVACALERYRLANGNYPDSLAVLAPKFVASIPNDVISGDPLKYRRTDDGKFILYSVGWNEKDDGGKVVLTHDKKTAVLEQGDWVWPIYP